MPRRCPPQRIVAAALALTGGYVDVICFVRYSTFVVTMTGNLVITGQTLYETLHVLPKGSGAARTIKGHSHIKAADAVQLVLFRMAVMLCNCLGAFTFCWLQRRYPRVAPSTAAPFIALLAVLPDLVDLVSESEDPPVNQFSTLSTWSVCFLAFGGGATHFLCSPAAEASRLKAVTMAATGHMHGVSKLLYRISAGDALKPSDWEKARQSVTITLGMGLGAVLGAAAMHLNPIATEPNTDDGLLVPVAITLFFALRAHDAYLEPPGGWPAADAAADPGAPRPVTSRADELLEPLAKAATPV